MQSAALKQIDPEPSNDVVSPHPHFGAIGRVIDYLTDHYVEQPSLERLAAVAGMAPHHFQRVFTRWAGVSPKRYCQHLTLERAKQSLEQDAPVLEAAWDAGLSGGGRLHDLFTVAEAMTPGEYKQRGAGMTIRYALVESPFGKCLLATTGLGICWLGFPEEGEEQDAVGQFKADWHASQLVEDHEAMQAVADTVFDPVQRPTGPISLHIKGTNWQLKVWRALLGIPEGRMASYQSVARQVGAAKAARAVGQAVAVNPISYLIPCHRVIRANGDITNYRWGTPRKRAILAFEAGR
ncbi:MAG: methylated-DNA--[protein]-cysteine S-methyltransferase [Pseudomonadota bacterium]